jgi:ubiquinone/menaquinone biosynthesis C-methylase UbiE
MNGLSPAAEAFDAVADAFDVRFGGWESVAAQRRAVRAELLAAFPLGARVLEIGGGTGEDALFLAQQGRSVLLTDVSPAMVAVARQKLRSAARSQAMVAGAEDLSSVIGQFDGAFSNFAALNCVTELTPVARELARLVRPGAPVLLVLFGTCPPGEVVVQLARGNTRGAIRRLASGDVPARLGGRPFVVRYHRAREIERVFRPWFRLVARRGVGVFVPPSAAEPWITAHPRLLSALESLDRIVARPLAGLGDHVLYRFERREP